VCVCVCVCVCVDGVEHVVRYDWRYGGGRMRGSGSSAKQEKIIVRCKKFVFASIILIGTDGLWRFSNRAGCFFNITDDDGGELQTGLRMLFHSGYEKKRKIRK